MSTNNNPITGWVAWHPKWGVTRVALSRVACVDRLLGVDMSEFKKAEEYFATMEHEETKLMEEGWRFRPVELRFTDEGEG